MTSKARSHRPRSDDPPSQKALAAGLSSTAGHAVPPTVAGVVLAAGRGHRMGRSKALVEIDDVSLLTRSVEVLTSGGCDPIGVVTGAEASKVTEVVPPQAERLHNPQWSSGMASSVAAALLWAGSGSAGALLILPVDTPGIGAAAIRRLIHHWRQGGARRDAVLVATYQGQQRNPVLIARDHWSDITKSLTGDAGARQWLTAHPELLTSVACEDIADPTDLDTPQDLARWIHDQSSTTRQNQR